MARRSTSQVKGISVPLYDAVQLTYVGSTNNLNTATYTLNGETVAVLTCEYFATPSADDALLKGVEVT